MKGNSPYVTQVLMIVGIFCLTGCRQHTENKKAINPVSVKIPKIDSTRNQDTAVLQKKDSARIIFLTFDDGPFPGTDNIIDVVTHEKVPVTMFMVGRQVVQKPKLQVIFHRAWVNPYMDVDNHSFSHAGKKYNLYYQNPRKVLEDFENNQAKLQLRDKDARMPGRNTWWINNRLREAGQVNGQQAASLLHQNGYTLFGWDMEWEHDPVTARPKQTVSEVLKGIETGLYNPKKCFTPGYFVLLAHDEMFHNEREVDELRQLIDSLRVHQFRFESIKNYPRN